MGSTPNGASKGTYTLSAADHTLVGTPLLKQGEPGDTTVSTEAGTLLLVPQTVSGAELEITLCVKCETEVREISMPPLAWQAGKLYNYTLVIADNAVEVWDFDYIGAVQTFTVSQAGTYRLEAWGAQGGVSGQVAAGFFGSLLGVAAISCFAEAILSKNSLQ